jgi:hypothetical protein
MRAKIVITAAITKEIIISGHGKQIFQALSDV